MNVRFHRRDAEDAEVRFSFPFLLRGQKRKNGLPGEEFTL
jgi:hypothetical protein